MDHFNHQHVLRIADFAFTFEEGKLVLVLFEKMGRIRGHLIPIE